MYSKKAMAQLTSTAIHQGLAERFFRWAYQAKVMKTLESTRSPTKERDAGKDARFAMMP